MRDIVILGAGQAGLQAAASLRQEGFDGRVSLVGAEPGLPYQRPPLSKACLQGGMRLDSLLLRPESFFSANRIDFMGDCEAVAIDRAARRVALGSGGSLPYGHLILALGAATARVPIEGAGLDGVLSLRTREDAEALKRRLGGARQLLVVGAGFIGMEVAAVAEGLGVHACVLEAEARPMAKSVSAPVSAFLAAAHVQRGSALLTSTRAGRIVAARRRVCAVETQEGLRLPADLVLLAAGVVPRTALAAEAGLRVDDGIVVDRTLLTSDPAISAIGDCARFPSLHAGGPVRVESVQNAIDQARCVAARLAGRPRPYDAVPWFWSDQGPHKLQIVGITRGHDRAVLRGQAAEQKFSVFCYREGRLVGIESVNCPADHMAGRRILAAGIGIAPEQAADPGFDLRALAGVGVPAPAARREAVPA